MSKVQTAAEVAEKKLAVTVGKIVGAYNSNNTMYESIEILREFISEKIEAYRSKQLQPQPDESDEAVAREIDVECVSSSTGKQATWVKFDGHKASSIIARHTAAKVASAKKQGYAEGYNDCAFKQNNAFWDKRLDEREERGWNRGAEAAMGKVALIGECIAAQNDGKTKWDKGYRNGARCVASEIRCMTLPEYTKATGNE